MNMKVILKTLQQQKQQKNNIIFMEKESKKMLKIKTIEKSEIIVIVQGNKKAQHIVFVIKL